MDKAKILRVVTTGNWKGHPYRHEETFAASEYQVSGWWMMFIPKERRMAIEALKGAKAGDRFVWESDDWRTEIIAE